MFGELPEAMEPIQPSWLPACSELPGWRWLASIAAISLLVHLLILVLLAGVVVVEQKLVAPVIDTRADFLAPDLRIYPAADSGDNDGGPFLVDSRGDADISQQLARNGPDQKAKAEFQVRGILRVDYAYRLEASPDATYLISNTYANLEPYAGREVILTCKSSSSFEFPSGRTGWLLEVAAVAPAAPLSADTFEISGHLQLLMGNGPAWQLATYGQKPIFHRIKPAPGVDLWPFSYRKVRLTVARETGSPQALIVHRVVALEE
jgi:hypothetical protein